MNHLQDLAFNIEIGGGGPSPLSGVVGVKRTRSIILGIGHALAKFKRWEPGLCRDGVRFDVQL